MRLFVAVGVALLLGSGVNAAARDKERDRYDRTAGRPVANPSAIVKAELSFARLAREKGQWTAFRETAADDAIMFVPNITNAQLWLKNKADPPQAVEWQPHKIYMSCDGTMGVSTGAWQDAKGGTGSFTTIWRQENFDKRHRRKETEWKWVFDHGVSLDEPLPEPDFIESKVASCKEPVTPLAFSPRRSGERKLGKSKDGTLIWEAIEKADGSRKLFIMLWTGTTFDVAVKDEIAATSE